MSFRLVPNSVTLYDLERRNSPNRRVISPSRLILTDFYSFYIILITIKFYIQLL